MIFQLRICGPGQRKRLVGVERSLHKAPVKKGWQGQGRVRREIRLQGSETVTHACFNDPIKIIHTHTVTNCGLRWILPFDTNVGLGSKFKYTNEIGEGRFHLLADSTKQKIFLYFSEIPSQKLLAKLSVH